MATEIEYKFLVDKDFIYKVAPFKTELTRQGYLSTDPVVRVRISHFNTGEEDAMITIKGPQKGKSRSEFEYGVPVKDAKELMKLCGSRKIEKVRYFVQHGEHVIEVDVFDGQFKGLVMAEIEVKSEDEKVDFPDWFIKDVSTDFRFTNAHLSTLACDDDALCAFFDSLESNESN